MLFFFIVPVAVLVVVLVFVFKFCVIYREEVTNLTIVNVVVSNERPYCYRSVSLSGFFFTLIKVFRLQRRWRDTTEMNI